MGVKIKISGYTFVLPEGFAPNHVCTPAEAKALTQIWAENIRSNVTELVRQTLDTWPLPVAMKRAQQHITQYAKDYKFPPPTLRSPPPDLFDQLVHEIAWERAGEWASSVGATEEAHNDKAQEMLADQTTLEMAYQRLEQIRSGAGDLLEELLGGGAGLTGTRVL